MAKTKTIFISSTFEDLKNHRAKIWDLLGPYDVNIRGMEKFGARKEAPLATCLSEVEQCDVFLGIIAFKLGSIDTASGKSFTQREYERAFELKKDILIYVADEKDSKVSVQNIDFDEQRQKLVVFKSILKERHTIDTFISEDDLVRKVKRRFDELLAQKQELELPGEDEYIQSKTLIDRFLLLPKAYSGQEAKLEINFVGKPFPASKVLCSNFNLSYGETIGIPIEILRPEIQKDVIKYIYITKDKLEEFFALKQKRKVEIYGKLQFSENEIVDVCANFIRQVYQEGGVITLPAQSLALSMPGYFGYQPVETKIIEAEGTLIIKLTNIGKQSKS